jgi:hypothetical protein
MSFTGQLPNLIIGIIGSLIASGIVYFLNLRFSIFNKIKAYVSMYYVGKLRGLWSNKALNKLIQGEYEQSDEIKIKVTRGYGLFFKEDGIFHKCIFENPNRKDKKTIKILLHYPCLESNHILQRAITNQITREKYVEDLFLVLELLKRHSSDPNTPEKIFVRFYTSDEDKEWRYYIFRKKSEEKVLLFNHYNGETSGSKSRMLKILGDNDSLCEELNREFDDIFDNYSKELLENLINSRKLINQGYCGHPGCKTKITEIHDKIFNN